MGDVREGLETAITAARHLTNEDEGAIAAARALADKIDAWDVIVQWAIEDAAADESRPKVPQNDNTSLGTFLKYCEQLGLTPLARKGVQTKEGAGGKLAQLRAVEGDRSKASGKRGA